MIGRIVDKLKTFIYGHPTVEIDDGFITERYVVGNIEHFGVVNDADAVYTETIVPTDEQSTITYYLGNWPTDDDGRDVDDFCAQLNLCMVHELCHWAHDGTADPETHADRWNEILIRELNWCNNEVNMRYSYERC